MEWICGIKCHLPGLASLHVGMITSSCAGDRTPSVSEKGFLYVKLPSCGICRVGGVVVLRGCKKSVDPRCRHITTIS